MFVRNWYACVRNRGFNTTTRCPGSEITCKRSDSACFFYAIRSDRRAVPVPLSGNMFVMSVDLYPLAKACFSLEMFLLRLK